MNILLIDREFPPNPHGGIGSYDLAMAEQLFQHGHGVTVLTLTENETMLLRKEEFGTVISFPHRPYGGGASSVLWADQMHLSLKLRKIVDWVLQEYPVDLIEIPSSGGYGASLARKLRNNIPIVTRFHGAMGNPTADPIAWEAYRRELIRFKMSMFRFDIARLINYPLWELERFQLNQSCLVTTPTYFAKNWLNQRTKVRNIKVIQNGVDIDICSRILKESQSRTDGNRRTKRIIFAGRCSIPKGVGVLLRAFPEIIKAEPDCELICVGPHTDRHILNLLQQVGLKYPGKILFPGRYSNQELLSLMAVSDAIVHPTFYEVSPMIAIEAMALGVPVVASNTGPLEEIVVHGETGYLFEVGNSSALAESLISYLELDSKKKQEMKDNSMNRVNTLHNIRTITEQLLSIYSTLC